MKTLDNHKQNLYHDQGYMRISKDWCRTRIR